MRWWGSAALPLLVLAACSAPSTPSLPEAGSTFDYQLGGAHPPAGKVEVVVRDRTADPDPDRWSVCYVNAFQTQPGTEDVPDELLLHDAQGAPVEDPDWPGEYVLDISTPELRESVVDVVGPWIDRCADDGFDAVEPDNVDSWTRSGGLLDRADAVAMARLLVDRAHEAGLDIAQKNAAELLGEDIGFDFAVVEDCAAFDECGAFADAYDLVLAVEYDDDSFAAACAAGGISVQRRDLAVSPPGTPGYVARWCTR